MAVIRWSPAQFLRQRIPECSLHCFCHLLLDTKTKCKGVVLDATNPYYTISAVQSVGQSTSLGSHSPSRGWLWLLEFEVSIEGDLMSEHHVIHNICLSHHIGHRDKSWRGG